MQGFGGVINTKKHFVKIQDHTREISKNKFFLITAAYVYITEF